MKKQAILFTVLRILLSICLCAGILLTAAAFAVSAVFSENAVKRALEKQELPALAMQHITDNVEDLQGIINVETDKILSALSAEALEKELVAYTDALTAQLLTGENRPYTVTFDSPALRQLVDSTLSADLYPNDPQQMQADREAVYDEIIAVIDGQLAFFPQTLLDKAIAALTDLGGLYDTVRLIKSWRLPLLLLTLLSAAALFFTYRSERLRGLRRVGGVGFLTASAVFLPVLLLRHYTLFDRLSLSDGLLRRYLLCLLQHVRTALYTTALCCFVTFLLLLAVSLFFSAKKLCKTCKSAENMLP